MNTTTNNENSNKPEFYVYHVRETGKGKNVRAYWNRVGVAFNNKNGKGLSLRLDYVPTNFDGYLQLQEPKEKDSE